MTDVVVSSPYSVPRPLSLFLPNAALPSVKPFRKLEQHDVYVKHKLKIVSLKLCLKDPSPSHRFH